MKIKNGDKVRLKSGLIVGECYDGIVYLDGMKQFENMIFTVINVDEKYRTCKILDSKYYSFTFSFEMLELVEYSADDLLNYLLANSGKTKEQLIEEYCCVREKEHSKKALANFFNKVIHSMDYDFCNECMVDDLCLNCNDDTCKIISVLNILIKNNLLDLDKFNNVFSYDDNDKDKGEE